MTKTNKPLRHVDLRRSLILGTVTASLAAPMTQAAPIVAKHVQMADQLWLAAGEGTAEGESEGGRVDPAITELRDLGLAEAHLRTAMALIALGQDEAAAAHLDMAATTELPGTPGAALGTAIAAVRDGNTDTALAAVAEFRAAQPEITRIAGLIALMRQGADLYTQATGADPADPQALQARTVSITPHAA